MNDPHKILLITTGGTIAGQVSVDNQDEAMLRKANQFQEIILPTIAYLNRKYSLDIEVQTFELVEVDSSNIKPTHWKALATKIKEVYDDFDSFVITHGTNTLGYTCAALSFSLLNPNKPIILTGSQVSAGLPGSDALTNLENALRLAVWPRIDRLPIKGVMAVFGSHIITGTRVKKDTEFDYDAFKSFNSGSLGRIGRIIEMNETNLKDHLDKLSTPSFPAARKAKDLRCENDFEMRILSLTEYPGMEPEYIKRLVQAVDAKGVILRAFGAGDPSSDLVDSFHWLKEQRIPIVVTTQAPNGNSNFQVNEPGQALVEANLAIPAFDMSIEAQTTKLAWLLAKQRNRELTYEQIPDLMRTNLKGEIKVDYEVGA